MKAARQSQGEDISDTNEEEEEEVLEGEFGDDCSGTPWEDLACEDELEGGVSSSQLQAGEDADLPLEQLIDRSTSPSMGALGPFLYHEGEDVPLESRETARPTEAP